MCSKREVTVGLSISLTGKFRPQGEQALQGIRLWQSYINAQGGIAVRNGEKRSVRLIWYDDHSRISFARKNVLQLLQEDRVDILLGAVFQQFDDSRSADCGRIQEGAMELWRLLR
jgi:ABC-type branched-subunit amino acid transport system substrate-binding protein